MGNFVSYLDTCNACGNRKVQRPMRMVHFGHPGEDDGSGSVQIDELRAAFTEHARGDGMMDRQEFASFAEGSGFTPEFARQLWIHLDRDGNRVVDAEEFQLAMSKFMKMRSRGKSTRYCPTCSFAGNCAYCLTVKGCPLCSTEGFCHEHWTAHPGKPQDIELSSSDEEEDMTEEQKEKHRKAKRAREALERSERALEEAKEAIAG